MEHKSHTERPRGAAVQQEFWQAHSRLCASGPVFACAALRFYSAGDLRDGRLPLVEEPAVLVGGVVDEPRVGWGAAYGCRMRDCGRDGQLAAAAILYV